MDERLREAIDGAEAYESLHVPSLFEEWAPRVLDAADVASGHRVLDVACGTGILARMARARVGSSGTVAGVDPNRGMLTVARRLDPRVHWWEGTAEALPVEDDSLDRVLSQFGMMFFTEPARAIEEMVRVLVPGGRFAIAVWDSLQNSPAYSREVDLLESMAGEDAANALRAPFALGDAAALGELVESAACCSVRVSTVVGRGRFPSIRSMVEADLRGWLPVMGVDLEEDLIAAILAAAEGELAEFVLPDGRTDFSASAHILNGCTPA
ncbi:MAG: methyltransferase domain-containing protein [Longimicrobiales bacterium]|nr:methyltransferase domain-containing protein [Longimicrobiales bacterium]